MITDTEARFATYVATLGRGPGRSRALTRAEACDAFGLALAGACDPHQLGAFLMLLRYRGEDGDEIAGLVEASRADIASRAGAVPGAGGMHEAACDLDWPSYGAGRTRGAPWFLLAALALADRGVRVLMHGTNEFTGGITVADGLAALGQPVAHDLASAYAGMAERCFAYLPLAALSPPIAAILALRHLLGLRSPVNTVCRLIDPANAAASVDGVFHPPYIEVHLATAERLGRRRLLVLKGGGGEAERAPGKTVAVNLTDRTRGRAELSLPAIAPGVQRDRNTPDTADLFTAVWRGDAAPADAVATIVGTIALGLLAHDPTLDPAAADHEAARVWRDRRAA